MPLPYLMPIWIAIGAAIAAATVVVRFWARTLDWAR
jgi:hypothetical protein